MISRIRVSVTILDMYRLIHKNQRTITEGKLYVVVCSSTVFHEMKMF